MTPHPHWTLSSQSFLILLTISAILPIVGGIYYSRLLNHYEAVRLDDQHSRLACKFFSDSLWNYTKTGSGASGRFLERDATRGLNWFWMWIKELFNSFIAAARAITLNETIGTTLKCSRSWSMKARVMERQMKPAPIVPTVAATVGALFSSSWLEKRIKKMLWIERKRN